MSLTLENFDKLLSLLDEDRERAGERYEGVRRKLIKFFEWRGSLAPEERADETINRVARKLGEGEAIRSLEAYSGGVARMVWLEELREREREHKALENLPPPISLPPDDEADLRLACSKSCFERLPDGERALLAEYYREEGRAKVEARRGLAARLGVPLNVLRIRVHRLRARLDKCVADCCERGNKT